MHTHTLTHRHTDTYTTLSLFFSLATDQTVLDLVLWGGTVLEVAPKSVFSGYRTPGVRASSNLPWNPAKEASQTAGKPASPYCPEARHLHGTDRAAVTNSNHPVLDFSRHTESQVLFPFRM